jgi:uncharacterized membrane protein YhhN
MQSMVNVVLISVIAGAVASLLVAIRTEERALEILSKAAASLGFVILGAANWSPGDPVGSWIVAGLVLCAVGDLLLRFDQTFDLGLFSFLGGHLAYVTAFATALPVQQWRLLFLAPVVLTSVGALSWLWPHLGRRKASVSAYVVTISIMVWGSLSVASAETLGWTVAFGALLFYLSDLFVARHRFVTAEFLNRGLGLPIYYTGQILIALSIS